MDSQNILRIAVMAGEIMLSNGAETYRVEDTITRIMRSHNCENAEAFVIPTGIVAGLTNENGTLSMVKRVKSRTYHLEKVTLVNELSRNISAGNFYSLAEIEEKLKEIKETNPYPLMVRIFASGFACFSFTYIFGGNLLDSAAAFIIGLAAYFIMDILRNVSGFLANIIGGAVIAFLALILLNLGLGNALDKIIIGSIMILVPGVAITNGVRDILAGDYLSGSSRIIDAIFVAVAIAAGVGGVLRIWLFIWGGF